MSNSVDVKELQRALQLCAKVNGHAGRYAHALGQTMVWTGAVGATDLDNFLTVRFETGIEPCGIEAKPILAALKGRKGPIAVGRENGTVKVGSMSVTAHSIDEAPTFPDWADRMHTVARIEAKTLLWAIDATLPAVSTDQTRAEQMCLYLCGNSWNAALVATNGHRLHEVRFGPSVWSGDLRSSGILISTGTAKLLQHLLKGNAGSVGLRIDAVDRCQFACVESTQWTLTFRVVDGSFPPYLEAFPNGPMDSVTVDVAELSAACRELLPAAEPTTRLGHFVAAEYGLTLRAGTQDRQAEVRLATSGWISPVFEWGMSLKYLFEALQAVGGTRVRISWQQADRAFILEPLAPGSPSTRALIMPLRLPEPAAQPESENADADEGPEAAE